MSDLFLSGKRTKTDCDADKDSMACHGSRSRLEAIWTTVTGKPVDQIVLDGVPTLSNVSKDGTF